MNKNVQTYVVRSQNFDTVVTKFEVEDNHNAISKVRAKLADMFNINTFEAQQRYDIQKA